MDSHNALLGCPYYSHGKTTEELRQSLLYTTLELEQTKMFAQEEIRKRDEQLIHLKDILTKTLKERDEAVEKSQRLMFDHSLSLRQQQQKHMTPLSSGASSIEDEQVELKTLGSNKSFSSSDGEESIMSPISHHEEVDETRMDPLFVDKPLPEKGKLLQAVIKAGPLLQTLLLAGPLPQWRYPPPPLKNFEIPPVTIHCPIVNNGCGKFNKKRPFAEGQQQYSETKYQKVLLH